MSGRWRAGIALALFVAATVLVTWRAHRLAQSLEEREKSKTSALRGQPAPEFSLPVLTPAGQSAPAAAELALADYRGQIVLISFWASWCRPCDYELPLLNQFYLARREQGVQVIQVRLGKRLLGKQTRDSVALPSGQALRPFHPVRL